VWRLSLLDAQLVILLLIDIGVFSMCAVLLKKYPLPKQDSKLIDIVLPLEFFERFRLDPTKIFEIHDCTIVDEEGNSVIFGPELLSYIRESYPEIVNPGRLVFRLHLETI
jgi:hypothetical protein